MKVLITGGSGLVGSELSKKLIAQGNEVVWLSRKESFENFIPRFKWDIENNFIDSKAFEGVDVVVHLAGKNIGEGRWTPKFKEQVLKSRIDSTKLLIKTINALDKPPKVTVCASAIGYYGNTGDELVDESASAGNDFLAEVVTQWEKAMDDCTSSRLVKLRLGVVLSKKGGALNKITLPIKLGIGSPLGNGKQWMSWVSLEDVVGLIIHSIENKNIKGAYNAVAPNPLTNKEATKRIAKFYHRPSFLPNVPEFVLKMMLGESAALVLNSNKVKSSKKELTYEYAQSEIEKVL